MTTNVEAANDLYGQLKPFALNEGRRYVLHRTPPYLQAIMPGIIDADIQNMASNAVAPAVVDRPYVSQAGLTLSCSLGNWTGTPTSRTYEWRRDGVVVGGNTPTLVITGADATHVYFCNMVATNAAGSSPVTPSNVITAV